MPRSRSVLLYVLCVVLGYFILMPLMESLLLP